MIKPSKATYRIGALVLFFAYIFVYNIFYSPSLYVGVDGHYFMHTARAILDWSRPSINVVLNPLVSATSLHFPINPWFNPIYLPFLIEDTQVSAALSYSLAILIYLSATFVFLRTLRINTKLAALASFVPCALVFPPFSHAAFGLTTGMQANPGIAADIAVYLIGISLIIKLGAPGARPWIYNTIGLGLLLFWGIAVDPFWMMVLCISVSPFGVFALIAGGGLRGFGQRTASVFLIALCFFAVGVLEYLYGLASVTSREYFSSEIWTTHRRFPWGAFPLANQTAFYLSGYVLLGLLLALIFGNRQIRLFSVAAIFHMILIMVLTLYYVSYPGNWELPRPTYLERAGMPLYFSFAAVGWLFCLRWLIQKSRALQELLAGARHALTAARLPIVGFAVAGLAGFPIWLSLGMAPDRIASRVPDNVIIELFADKIAMEPNSAFRGRLFFKGAKDRQLDFDFTEATDHNLEKSVQPIVRIYDPAPEERNTGQLVGVPGLLRQWHAGIPTIGEYGQMITPEMYFLATRMLASLDYISTQNNLPLFLLDGPGLEFLAALGTRFMIEFSGSYIDGEIDLGQPGYNNIFEITNVNLGQYSPTNTLISKEANQYPGIMGSSDFDFRRQVILSEPLDFPLVEAEFSKLVFERGAIRVKARSSGRSLLLLPVQYSHCMQAEPNDNVQIVRANLVQTGIVFSGELDIKLRFEFGPLTNTHCRLDDLAELREVLNLHSDGTRPVPKIEDVAPWSPYPMLSILTSRLSQVR